MSENIPESIPTSADPRSKRPTKKRALTPVSQQSAAVEALFKNPDREIKIPTGEKQKTLAPPPEIVANVQGSSAGAGSGEFHVYKASRRREYDRLRLMDEEVKKQEADKEFAQKREEAKKADEEKTNKNRARRQKAKQRKEKAKTAHSAQMDTDVNGKEAAVIPAKKMQPNPTIKTNGHEGVPHDNLVQDDENENASVEEDVGITIQEDD
jgi:hypothetical protein